MGMQNNYYKASMELAKKAQKDMEFTVRKTTEAQEVYLHKSSKIYSEDEIANIRYFLDALLYKYQLANYSLEQLWVMRDAKVEASLFEIFNNSITSLKLTDNEVFLQSHILEQFLFQGRSYLDFYMLYLAYFLRTGHTGAISTDNFYRRLTKAKPELLRKKADDIETYFRENVFSLEKRAILSQPTNWGVLLKSLRDRIAHRDRIKISMNGREQIMNDILLDMPTLQDLTYERFCQAMEKGM